MIVGTWFLLSALLVLIGERIMHDDCVRFNFIIRIRSTSLPKTLLMGVEHGGKEIIDLARFSEEPGRRIVAE